MRTSIIILLSVLLTGCGSFVQFQRVQYDHINEKYIFDRNISKHDQENIIYVLNIFNEEYFIKNDKLYISRKLWNDKERLWNYCNKADDEWINKYENFKKELEQRRQPQ